MISPLCLRNAEVKRATIIARTLGIYVAARYLRKRDWSLEAAVYILTGRRS